MMTEELLSSLFDATNAGANYARRYKDYAAK